jgi:uncharacterized protein (DUF1697 family)
MRFIALLRGINVGGNNIIKMVDLKACFVEMGFQNVATYIQSGNVAFDAEGVNADNLTAKIEKGLSERFNYDSVVVVVPQIFAQQVVEKAPEGFGSAPDDYRYDVFFLKSPMTATEAMTYIKAREGVDFVTAGDGVIYFSRLIAKAGQSYMTGILKTALYKHITIRNWNTTSKLTSL